jgi:hypothetical protein
VVEPLPRGRNPVRTEPLPRNPGGKVLKAQLREQTIWGQALRREPAVLPTIEGDTECQG